MLLGASIGNSLEQRAVRYLLACLKWDPVGCGRSEFTWKYPVQIQLPLVVNHGGGHEAPEVLALEGGGYYDSLGW